MIFQNDIHSSPRKDEEGKQPVWPDSAIFERFGKKFALKYNFLKNTAVATFWSTFVDKNWLIFNSTSGHTANNNRRRRHSNRIQFLFRVRFCILNW